MKENDTREILTDRIPPSTTVLFGVGDYIAILGAYIAIRLHIHYVDSPD